VQVVSPSATGSVSVSPGTTAGSASVSADYQHLQPLDVLDIRAVGTIVDQPISGFYFVEPDGNVSLGPAYGRANVKGLTYEQAEEKITRQLENILTKPEVQVTLAKRLNKWREVAFGKQPYTISVFDVLQVRAIGTMIDQPVDGFFLVEATGTIALGPSYGRVQVQGLTLDAAEKAVQKKLKTVLNKPEVQVTVPTPSAPSAPANQVSKSAVYSRETAMPKSPYTIKPGDLLFIDAIGTLINQPIQEVCFVEPAGTIALGPAYGRVKIEGLTLEEAERAIKKKLQAVLFNPEVSVTLAGWMDETDITMRTMRGVRTNRALGQMERRLERTPARH
jgi:protein involved in polysaccharide export with SLBB domain